MKLPDVNLWLALAISGHSHHAIGRKWLDEQDAPSSLFLCRMTQQGLVRLLTTGAVLAPYGIPARTNREAWTVVEEFLADDRISFIDEPPGIEEEWKKLALRDTRHRPSCGWTPGWPPSPIAQGCNSSPSTAVSPNSTG